MRLARRCTGEQPPEIGWLLSVIAREPTYIPPKTKSSRRTVPLPAATTNLLRNYLKRHPHCADPTAPLFPSVRLRPPQPTGEDC